MSDKWRDEKYASGPMHGMGMVPETGTPSSGLGSQVPHHIPSPAKSEETISSKLDLLINEAGDIKDLLKNILDRLAAVEGRL